MADTFYRFGGADATLFEGVSLGKAYRWLFWALSVQPAFRFLGALGEVLRVRAPAVVRCETSLPPLYRALLSAAAGPWGFRVEWVERPEVVDDILRWVPPQLQMPAAKRLALAASNAAAALRSRGGGPVVWVSWYASLEPVLGALTDAGLNWKLADPPPLGLARRALAEGWRVQLESWTPPRWGASLPAELVRLARHWAEGKTSTDYRATFVWRGVDLFPAFEPALDNFFSRQAPAAAWACRGLQRAWERDKPAAVVLPYDYPPFQSLLSQVAAAHGRPTIGLLHGLPFAVGETFADEDYSRFLVWGEEQKRQHERAGLRPPPELIALGNPQFDRYAGVPRREPAGFPRPLRVLAVTRPRWSTSLLSDSFIETEQYAVGLARVVAAVPGLSLRLRLHPSEQKEYYRRLLKDHPEVELERGTPLMESLLDADIVLGAFSTVLLDAIVLGRPVLIINVTRRRYSPPFDGSRGIDPVTSWDELQRRLEAVVASPEREFARLCEPYPGLIEAFAGPQDGGAARRVSAEILSAARGQ